MGYSIDNLSADQDGDVYVAMFPVGIDILLAFKDPKNARPASGALRLREVGGEYVVEKVIEDKNGEVLPASTTVVRDAKTGRLFFGSKFPPSIMSRIALLTMPGVVSPFISVCDPIKA